MPLEQKRGLYVATTSSWKDFKPCRALAVPRSPVVAYKEDVMVDVHEDRVVSIERDVYPRVASPTMS